MKRAAFALVGALVFVSPPAALLASVAATPAEPTLVVEMPAGESHVIASSPATPIPAFNVGPSSLGDRLKEEVWQPTLVTGTAFRTYSATWGDRWREEATVPALVGPFHKPEEFVCGYHVGVSAEVLNTKTTAKPLRDVVSSLVKRFAAKPIEKIGVKVAVPPLRDVDVALEFHANYVESAIRLEFEDRSFIAASLRLTLVSREGRPAIQKLGPAKTTFGGPAFVQLGADFAEKALQRYLAPLDVWPVRAFVRSVGAFVADTPGGRHVVSEGIQEKVDDSVERALIALNSALARFTVPWRPWLREGNATEIAFRLGAQPQIDASGLRASICMQWSSPASDLGADVPGPIASPRGLGAPMALTNERPLLQMRASADAINQLLWGVWRAGKLRDVGKMSSLLAFLDDSHRKKANEIMQSLAFKVEGLDPKLPPTVVATSDGASPAFLISVADAEVGSFEGHGIVVAHAQGTVSLAQSEDEVRVGLKMLRASANCVDRRTPGASRLVPCLSDLLPPLREEVVGKSKTFTLRGTELLGHVPLPDLPIGLSNLRFASIPPGPTLDVTVEPSFNARALEQLVADAFPEGVKQP